MAGHVGQPHHDLRGPVGMVDRGDVGTVRRGGGLRMRRPMVAGGGRLATATAAAAAVVVMAVAAVLPAGPAAVAAAAPPSTTPVTSPAPGITPSLQAALVREGAYGSHPLRLLMVGDSIALTLGIGLAV